MNCSMDTKAVKDHRRCIIVEDRACEDATSAYQPQDKEFGYSVIQVEPRIREVDVHKENKGNMVNASYYYLPSSRRQSCHSSGRPDPTHGQGHVMKAGDAPRGNVEQEQSGESDEAEARWDQILQPCHWRARDSCVGHDTEVLKVLSVTRSYRVAIRGRHFWPTNWQGRVNSGTRVTAIIVWVEAYPMILGTVTAAGFQT
jgi:hypothetical protein